MDSPQQTLDLHIIVRTTWSSSESQNPQIPKSCQICVQVHIEVILFSWQRLLRFNFGKTLLNIKIIHGINLKAFKTSFFQNLKP